MKTKEHHEGDGRFVNPWSRSGPHRFLKLIKWLVFSRNRCKAEKRRPFPGFPVERPDFNRLESSGLDYAVWLGHSTVYMKAGPLRLITDPVFWNVTPFIRRKTPLPIDPRSLPGVDIVLVSHGHYDHLNSRSARFLQREFAPVFVSGPGYAGFFERRGIARRAELDWHESRSFKGVRVTALPVQHWSRRTIFDTNRHLWSSYLIESGGRRYYWIGDTGYYGGFRETGARFGPVDVLFVPVGAYEPRWFMRPFHVNPEEALAVARDVRARCVVPIHWGTFDLSDEPLTLPIKHLKEIHDPGKDPPLRIVPHGGSVVLAGTGCKDQVNLT